jgi:hypothetical protein
VWTPAERFPALDAVIALPADQLVMTNQPSAVYALTRRPAIALPLRTSPQTGAPNPGADRDLDELVDLLRDRRAVVVISRPAAFEQSLLGQPLVTEEQPRPRAADGGGVGRPLRPAHARPHLTEWSVSCDGTCSRTQSSSWRTSRGLVR